MRPRAVASTALAALVLLATSACSFIAPQATLKQYDPSDGIGTTVGDIQIMNALVVSGDGTDGTLVANILNSGTERVQVTLQYRSNAEKVDETLTVGAGMTENFGTPDGMNLTLTNIDTKPGELLPVFVQYGSFTGKQLMVPVLDGTLPEYADLVP